MNSLVEIVQTSDGVWYLRIEFHENEIPKHVTCKAHKTLIDALETATLLGIHVDNANDLPINQYKRLTA